MLFYVSLCGLVCSSIFLFTDCPEYYLFHEWTHYLAWTVFILSIPGVIYNTYKLHKTRVRK